MGTEAIDETFDQLLRRQATFGPHIVPILQRIPHTVRCIPFAGGLGIFYAWPKPHVSNNDDYREAINDHSELLINLYRVARKHPDEFERLISLTPYSQADYRGAIKICRNPDQHSDIDFVPNGISKRVFFNR